MAQPGQWTTDRVLADLSAPSPRLLRRLSVGIALLGHPEEPPGSCVLVVDDPQVRRLSDLPRERRLGFLGDLDLLGEAVHHVCTRRDPGLRSVSLEVPGDGDLLHARARPRYASTPEGRHADLRTGLGHELDRICAAARGEYPAQHVYGSRPTRRSV